MNMLFINRFGVYHWCEYTFEDGSSKDKYWISLNCFIEQVEYHAILPTSKVEKNKFNTIDTLTIKENSSQYFKKETLLDFKKLTINNKDEISKAFTGDKFRYLGLLEQSIQDEIISTIENSLTLSEVLIATLLCTDKLK